MKRLLNKYKLKEVGLKNPSCVRNIPKGGICSNVNHKVVYYSTHEIQVNNSNSSTSLCLKYKDVASNQVSVNDGLSIVGYNVSLHCDTLGSDKVHDEKILIVSLETLVYPIDE